MAATDAKPFPIKNTAYRVYFPILDADGDTVTGATGLDSEASLDGGTFADCTNEATEIATSSGIYYLDLTSSEMNTDCTVIQVKTSSSGAKTTVLTLYPVDTGDIDVDVTAFGGTAGTFASGRPEVNTTHAAGTAWGSGAITAASIASDAITAAKIADGAIDSATFASGCTLPRCTLVDTTTTNADMINAGGIRSAVGLASASLDTQLSAIAGYIDTEIATVISQTTAASIRSAVGLSSANLDTQLTTIDDFLDTEINAIKAKTDLIPSDPADASDIAALIDALPTAAEIWDFPDGVEAGLTPRGAFRLCTSALVGKLSGAAGTTVVIRNVGDTKNRISATVDADGNRSAVTTDAT